MTETYTRLKERWQFPMQLGYNIICIVVQVDWTFSRLTMIAANRSEGSAKH
jgi:hypothetical protein